MHATGMMEPVTGSEAGRRREGNWSLASCALNVCSEVFGHWPYGQGSLVTPIQELMWLCRKSTGQICKLLLSLEDTPNGINEKETTLFR